MQHKLKKNQYFNHLSCCSKVKVWQMLEPHLVQVSQTTFGLCSVPLLQGKLTDYLTDGYINTCF